MNKMFFKFMIVHDKPEVTKADYSYVAVCIPEVNVDTTDTDVIITAAQCDEHYPKALNVLKKYLVNQGYGYKRKFMLYDHEAFVVSINGLDYAVECNGMLKLNVNADYPVMIINADWESSSYRDLLYKED